MCPKFAGARKPTAQAIKTVLRGHSKSKFSYENDSPPKNSVMVTPHARAIRKTVFKVIPFVRRCIMLLIMG